MKGHISGLQTKSYYFYFLQVKKVFCILLFFTQLYQTLIKQQTVIQTGTTYFFLPHTAMPELFKPVNMMVFFLFCQSLSLSTINLSGLPFDHLI